MSSYPKSERLKWLQAFSTLGIDAYDCMTMNDNDFKEKLQFCQECGLEPIEDAELAKAMALSLGLDESLFRDDPPKPEPTHKNPPPKQVDPVVTEPSSQYHYSYPKKKPNIPTRTDSGAIRDEQNLEYERLQREEAARIEKERKEKEAAMSRTKPTQSQPSKPKGSVKDEYKRLASKLPPEPANGVRIGFTFHDGKRITRKFDKSTKGEALKIFIQAEDNMFNPDGTAIGFSLQQTLGPQLDLKKTLEQQGIKKSAMFSVVLDD